MYRSRAHHHALRPTCGLALLTATLVAISSARAQPIIVEPGWTQIRTISFERPMGAHFNPVDGLVYVIRTDSTTDGLYRIRPSGASIRIATEDRPSALVADPTDGDLFVSEHYNGGIFRTAFGATGRETWVSGLHSGDDDPIGMAIAPADYIGTVLLPGEALVVDRGNSGLDEVWRFSPATPEGETVVHADNGTLIDAVDIAIGTSEIYVADYRNGTNGLVYRLDTGGVLTALTTSEPVNGPNGVTFDPQTGDLYVVDAAAGRLVRINPATGAVSDVITDLTLSLFNWTGVDVTPDGYQLVLTERANNSIYVFAQCDPAGDPESDCDENGVRDVCDIAAGTAPDCNDNGVPDECDITAGTSPDCDENGIPDDCPVCPEVELIFVMDTSASMDGEAAALCANMGYIIAELEAAGVQLSPLLLGISNTPGGAYSCLTDHVINLLGTTVPGTPPPGLETLGNCPGGNEVPQEDWALATAVVAGTYPWQTDALRLIMPLSDEGPWCGDPVTQNDNDAIAHAIVVANDYEVIVSPVTGSGSSSTVIALAQQLAAGTGGLHFSSAQPAEDIAEGIIDLVLDACFGAVDCNRNGTPDSCDLDDNTSADCNNNEMPDECEFIPPCPGNTNADCVVDTDDFLAVLGGWGNCDEPCPPYCGPDTNNDCLVNTDDFLDVLSGWGSCPDR